MEKSSTDLNDCTYVYKSSAVKERRFLFVMQDNGTGNSNDFCIPKIVN